MTKSRIKTALLFLLRGSFLGYSFNGIIIDGGALYWFIFVAWILISLYGIGNIIEEDL